MEMSQENSLSSYLKQTKMPFFSFTKSEKRAEQILSRALVPVGGGGGVERVKEGEYDANTVYTCM
jgi:predicted ATP-grasp superfamily ATP-dependent carboligase